MKGDWRESNPHEKSLKRPDLNRRLNHLSRLNESTTKAS